MDPLTGHFHAPAPCLGAGVGEVMEGAAFISVPRWSNDPGDLV